LTNTERQRQIRKLFDAASIQSQERQTDYVRRHAAGDAELAESVLRLLRAARDRGKFLAKPLVRREEETVSRNGARIGAYKIVRELGAGGMGVVYLAVRADEAFKRVAALKIIRSSFASSQMIDRFRQERQILASLDHPNIARILDGGTTDDGLPYFVMDYVDGLPLNVFCNNHRANLNQRLNLFRQACQAVHYLHTNRIVHRDLKPANILVTSEGMVKLLDFGIARLLDDNGEKRLKTAPMMTTDYASPEQMNSKPTSTATDIYSLGAILYELLTGSLPHNTRGLPISAAIETVTREEVVRPSARVTAPNEMKSRESAVELRGHLRGDLDSILLTALRKEPERRYASVNALAGDLQSYQSGRPVAARKASGLYVASKFAARNRMAIAAVLLIAAALCWGGWREWQYEHLLAIVASIQSGRAAFVGSASQEPKIVRDAKFDQQLAEVRRTYSEDFPKLVDNPFSSREKNAEIVNKDISWLSDAAPQADGNRDLAESVGRTWLALAQAQWNPEQPSLKDPQGALETYNKAHDSMRQLHLSDADLASLDDVEKELMAKEQLTPGYKP
jgi:eukaryotic-like serine/threonine-protein kinase